LRTSGLILSVSAVIIAFIFAVPAILSLSPWKLKVEHATEPFKTRWKTANKVLIGVAAVIGAVGVGLLAVAPAKVPATEKVDSNHPSNIPAIVKSTLKFSDPRGTIQNPLMEPCQAPIQVSGRVPNGYAFAVGNVVDGQNSDVAFVPEDAAVQVDSNTWQIPEVFGAADNNGEKFTVYLEVLPAQELTYLVAEAQSVRGALSSIYAGQTWWRAHGMPPEPALTEDQETVQRTKAKTGCPSS
jgi:hypothetical protein